MKNILDKIDRIEFKILSPDIIRTTAVVNVVNPELYDVDGYPIEGGLMDPRMGVIDPGIRCRTCGGKVKECPGHFGVIELARPVLHYDYIKIIYRIMKTTCKECGKIPIDDTEKEKIIKKLEKIKEDVGIKAGMSYIRRVTAKIRTKKKCPHCSTERQKITYEKPTKFIYERKTLTPIDIREWMEKIKDEDLELVGIAPGAGRPEWMILTAICVPPVTVRPSITLEGGQRSEDDLTHKLGDIVRTNQRLYENLTAGAPAPIIEDLWLLLQYHVTTFFDNEISQIPPARHRSGRPLKTLTSRLKGKEGRFRKNLSGKRVNFSSRTVISPDPRIGINEVGVPLKVAEILTVPERVTEWNIKRLKELIENGNRYPGACYVVAPDEKRKRITDETKKVILEELEPGYIVERHMQDGDIVLFNRQPSLHRMSMMSHKAKILPFKTFRLNLAVTTPYNADFDGDEMNLHLPQTEEARAEAEILMSVPLQVISVRHGTPIIGLIQDHISGCFMLTRKETKMSRKEAQVLLFKAGIETELPDKEELTGKEIISVIFPKDFNYEGKNKVYSEDDPESNTKIENGVIISGVIDAGAVGPGGKLLQEHYLKYGAEKTAVMIENLSQLGIQVLRYRGFTTLISDITLPKDAEKQVNEIKKESLKLSKELIEKYEKKELEAYPGKTIRETLELKIVNELNKARNKAINIVSNELAKEENHTLIMVKTRAKGSMLNIGLMSAFNGQTTLRGTRINKGYVKRVLPHFEYNELGPKSHGFIKSGFKEGLDPIEFFMSAITGRASLQDKSMSTPKSGYMQRRLINSLQDLIVSNDKTVRNDANEIVQFLFGEDGIDVSKSQGGKVNVKRIVERLR